SIVYCQMGPLYQFSYFFFSSRRRHTRSKRDWSSDVCSFPPLLQVSLADIHVFHRLRNLKQWWVAPTFSTVLGNLLDTFVFFFVAFWHSSNPFMAEHWVEIAWVDYVIKILISLVFFIPLYGALLKALLRWAKVRNKEIYSVRSK